MASSGKAVRTSARIRSGIIGKASLVCIAKILALYAARKVAIFSTNWGCLKPSGYISRATRFNTDNAALASATTPISVG